MYINQPKSGSTSSPTLDSQLLRNRDRPRGGIPAFQCDLYPTRSFLISMSMSRSRPFSKWSVCVRPPQQTMIFTIYQTPFRISLMSKTSRKAPGTLRHLGKVLIRFRYGSAVKVHRNTNDIKNISQQVMKAGVPTVKSRTETWIVRSKTP